MNKLSRGEAFERLASILDELRVKCPWDQKQTMESLRHLTLEETAELADSILDNNLNEVKKELGDLMLHILFYAKIAEEKKIFDITDVLNTQCEKMIHRHPHIYSDVSVDDADDVKRNWEKLKLKEGNESVLDGVPKSLSSLIKSMRIQEKARGVGFDWEKPEQVWEKVEEEMGEFLEESEAGNKERAEAEFGDLLFALVNYARFKDINPEEALERTNKKFVARFKFLEQSVKAAGKELSDMSLSEMDVYWNEAKKQHR
ncbi:MAG: nucleoside triphosphate pyrophosphohydrolase [Bacteroidetes bacterium]|nr:MAG: nucleoside triphosphate pyrophosphohydrolase [Bacteroidota bacterium]REK08094.1 MAG: nucleoside triphosphate pyrophosphohydrolase [Bacteroidota bacterium]REK32299.1 MAG: nucleoside triphosphate pyrophosphohydrolase [Bacteroidota bacterium]REK49533.1 MAG: nucleoside triphosphate pyrophosphohydrolase [Bacteroidota bacterium]